MEKMGHRLRGEAEQFPFGARKSGWSAPACPVDWLHKDVWEMLRQAQHDTGKHDMTHWDSSPRQRWTSLQAGKGATGGLQNELNSVQAGVEICPEQSQKRTQFEGSMMVYNAKK
jgi:hypothetical protein